MTGAPLRTVLIGLAVAALWAVATPSEACTCLENGPACEAYWKASTVFIGRVTAVSPPQTRKPGAAFLRSRRVTLEVSEAFSGVAGSTVEVTTGSGGGDCGFPFKEGLDYVVYATRPDPDAPLVVSVCSRTRVLAEASSDLAYARAVASGVPLTGTISGRVSLATRSLTPGVGKTTRPFAGAGIVLESRRHDHAGRDGVGRRLRGDRPGGGAVYRATQSARRIRRRGVAENDRSGGRARVRRGPGRSLRRRPGRRTGRRRRGAADRRVDRRTDCTCRFSMRRSAPSGCGP